MDTCTCICMAESLHYSPETSIIWLICYTPIQNKKFKKMKRNEIRTEAVVWMNLEHIMLNEITWAQKVTYCVIPFISNFQNR